MTGYLFLVFWWGHDADHAGLRPLPDAGFRARERYGVPDDTNPLTGFMLTTPLSGAKR